MRIKYNIPLQNNKGIPLFVNCSVFTFLRLQFKKLKLHIQCPFTGSSLVLEKNNNILPIESCLTYDYKNNRYTSQCAQTYVSLNFTPFVSVYLTRRGSVLTYTDCMEELYKNLDKAAEHLVKYSYAYVDIPKEMEKHELILKLLTLGEPVTLIVNKRYETDEYISYRIEYADEYRPELYY